MVDKRVALTLSKEYLADLEEWARSRGVPPTTMAWMVVCNAIDEARRAGEIHGGVSRYKSLGHLVMVNWDRLVEESKIPGDRLTAIMQGQEATEVELLRIAATLRITPREIEALSAIAANGGEAHAIV